jgi:uncharacterized protein (TIGR02246 family)
MRRALTLLTAFVACAMLPAMAAAQDDEAAIRKLSNDFFAAWTRHDVKAMAATFAEDADLINPFGRVAKGRAEIEKLFTDEHAGPFKGTSYEASVSLRMLTPGVALGDWDSSVVGMHDASGKALPPFKHHVAVVYVKKGGKWLAEAGRPYAFLPPPTK